MPVTIGLSFLLRFGSFSSLRQATLIILSVPFALIGGIIALFLTGQYLSVPASVGFIALFGVAVLDGVVLVTYINQVRAEGAVLTPPCDEGEQRIVVAQGRVVNDHVIPPALFHLTLPASVA